MKWPQVGGFGWPPGLRTYQNLAVDIRNRKATELFDTFGTDHYERNRRNLVTWYRKTSDPSLIRRFIDGIVDRSTHTYKDARPFELVLGETRDRVTGKLTRRVFNALDGRYHLESGAVGSCLFQTLMSSDSPATLSEH